MTKTLKFTKMHGCGNDYIYFDCFNQTIEAPEALSIRLSDRHKGSHVRQWHPVRGEVPVRHRAVP